MSKKTSKKKTAKKKVVTEGCEVLTTLCYHLFLGPSGETYLATIVEYNDDTVTFDMNHPMAGKTLNFDIEVVSITDSNQ